MCFIVLNPCSQQAVDIGKIKVSPTSINTLPHDHLSTHPYWSILTSLKIYTVRIVHETPFTILFISFRFVVTTALLFMRIAHCCAARRAKLDVQRAQLCMYSIMCIQHTQSQSCLFSEKIDSEDTTDRDAGT